jgi:hypothetical protein
MDTRAEQTDPAEQASPPGAPDNGAARRVNRARPITSLAARYLEDLRARRRVEPQGGLRIFNPDETPEERDQRIREALAGLDSLLAATDEEAEEQRETWEALKAALHQGRPPYSRLFSDP